MLVSNYFGNSCVLFYKSKIKAIICSHFHEIHTKHCAQMAIK